MKRNLLQLTGGGVFHVRLLGWRRTVFSSSRFIAPGVVSDQVLQRVFTSTCFELRIRTGDIQSVTKEDISET